MATKGVVCSVCGKAIGCNTRHGMCLAHYQSWYRQTHNHLINPRVNKWKVQYRMSHQEEIADYAKFERFRLRLEMIQAYGGKCECCGEDEPLFLTLDHIDGTGGQERRRLGLKSGGPFYRYLRRLEWPKDNYRLLCFNCNTAIGFWGICPHTLSKTIAYDGMLNGQASFRLWVSQGVGRPRRSWRTNEELDALWMISGVCKESVITLDELKARDEALCYATVVEDFDGQIGRHDG